MCPLEPATQLCLHLLFPEQPQLPGSSWGAVPSESPSLAGSAPVTPPRGSLWPGSLPPCLTPFLRPPCLYCAHVTPIPPWQARPGLPLPPSLSIGIQPVYKEAFWVCPGPQWSCLWNPEPCPLNTQGFSTPTLLSLTPLWASGKKDKLLPITLRRSLSKSI